MNSVESTNPSQFVLRAAGGDEPAGRRGTMQLETNNCERVQSSRVAPRRAPASNNNKHLQSPRSQIQSGISKIKNISERLLVNARSNTNTNNNNNQKSQGLYFASFGNDNNNNHNNSDNMIQESCDKRNNSSKFQGDDYIIYAEGESAYCASHQCRFCKRDDHQYQDSKLLGPQLATFQPAPMPRPCDSFEQQENINFNSSGEITSRTQRVCVNKNNHNNPNPINNIISKTSRSARKRNAKANLSGAICANRNMNRQWPARAISSPRVLPNNTLIADLSKCHSNLIHQLPQIGLETSPKRLLLSLKECLHPKRDQQHQQLEHRHLHHSNQLAQNEFLNHNHEYYFERQRRRSLDLEDYYAQPQYNNHHHHDDDSNNNDHTSASKYSSLRLDLMIPKSTNSLPASLISELDPANLMRLNETTNLRPDQDEKADHDDKKLKSCDQFNGHRPAEKENKRVSRREVKFEMPEALLGARVKLKREDYDKALCVLTSDIRYQLHLFLYSRVQSLWLLFSTIFCVFIPFVFMAPELGVISVAAALWLGLQMIGGAATFVTRKRLNRILERAVAQANSYFMDHNLMLGVINLGGIFAKSKLMVPLVYFDTTPCRLQIESILNGCLRDPKSPFNRATQATALSRPQNKSGSNKNNPDQKQQHQQQQLEQQNGSIPAISIISNKFKDIKQAQAQGPANCKVEIIKQDKGGASNGLGNALAISQLAKKIVLKYSQRWISQYDRRKLVFSADENDKIEPRHLSTGKCICQFFEAQYLARNSKQFDGNGSAENRIEPQQHQQQQHQPIFQHLQHHQHHHQLQQHQQQQLQVLVDPSTKQIQQMGFSLFALISTN